MEFEKVIKERYSCRKFLNKEVEEDKLMAVLQAGRIAPTAKNRQPFKIYVLNRDTALKKVDRISPCRYSSPCVLMIVEVLDEAFVRNDGVNFATIDASIVTTHMMLEATNVGLASVWVGLIDVEAARNEFHLPENYYPMGLLPLGYPDPSFKPSPMHSTKKKLEDIIVNY
jgi:nitroreductase